MVELSGHLTWSAQLRSLIAGCGKRYFRAPVESYRDLPLKTRLAVEWRVETVLCNFLHGLRGRRALGPVYASGIVIAS